MAMASGQKHAGDADWWRCHEACLSTTDSAEVWRLTPQRAVGFLEMSARRALKLAYDIEAWYRCADDAAIGAIGMEVAAVE
jgi:hypothetical protein